MDATKTNQATPMIVGEHGPECGNCGGQFFSEGINLQASIAYWVEDGKLVEADDWENAEVQDRVDFTCDSCGCSVSVPDTIESVEACDL